MSFRNWLPNPPIGVGIIVALLVATAALQNWQKQSECGQSPATEHCEQARGKVHDVTVAPVGAIKAPPRKPNPDRTEWRSERDLEAQWEMAYWAKVAAVAAWVALVVTFVGVLLVKQTLSANRAAVAEASKAAEAAQRSANISEDAFRRLERPYLFVRVDDLHCLSEPPHPHQPYVTCRFVNYGKLPAILRSVAVRLEYKPVLPLQILGDHKFYDVIQQGEVSTRPHQVMVQDSKIGQRFTMHAGLVLHGLICYEDPTGVIHTDRFCLRGLEDGAGFRVADEEYNWRDTEYPKPKLD